MVKVEYIYHSGFTVETDNYFLVFDYYKGDISLKDKKTIVFASHSHYDHFNPIILEWKDEVRDIQYVFGYDIETKGAGIHSLKPYKNIILDGVTIKAFGSTDAGVSFLVNVDNINIFHAGDLNWWYWDDDTENEKINMEKSFKKKIGRIVDLPVDIGFFPVDPRLGEYFHLGGEHFINEINPNYFFPMHFGDNYATPKDFIHKIGTTSTNIVDISKENQVFDIL